MNRPVPPIGYLLDCSQLSLHEFWNVQLNDSANCRKEVQKLLGEWIEATAMGLLAEWFSLYGEALIAAAGATPEERETILAALRIGSLDKAADVLPQVDAEEMALLCFPGRGERDAGTPR